MTGKRARQHLRQGSEEAEAERGSRHHEGVDRVGEPVVTSKLSSSPAKEFDAVPTIVPAYPANIQGVQRVVKEVMRASDLNGETDSSTAGRAARRDLILIVTDRRCRKSMSL